MILSPEVLEIGGRDPDSTASNVSLPFGRIWYVSLWEKDNRVLDDVGTPDQWMQEEERVIARAWDQLMSGEANKQARVLGRDYDVNVGNPHPDGYRSGRAAGSTCKNNHVFSPATTFVRQQKKNGKVYTTRECLICKNERNRKRYVSAEDV